MNQKSVERRLKHRINRRFCKICLIRNTFGNVGGRVADMDWQTIMIVEEVSELLATNASRRKPDDWQAWVHQYLPISFATAQKYVRAWAFHEWKRANPAQTEEDFTDSQSDLTTREGLIEDIRNFCLEVLNRFRDVRGFPLRRLTRDQILDYTLVIPPHLLKKMELESDTDQTDQSEQPAVDDPLVSQCTADDEALAGEVRTLIEKHRHMAKCLFKDFRKLHRIASRLRDLTAAGLVDERLLIAVSQ